MVLKCHISSAFGLLLGQPWRSPAREAGALVELWYLKVTAAYQRKHRGTKWVRRFDFALKCHWVSLDGLTSKTRPSSYGITVRCVTWLGGCYKDHIINPWCLPAERFLATRPSWRRSWLRTTTQRIPSGLRTLRWAVVSRWRVWCLGWWYLREPAAREQKDIWCTSVGFRIMLILFFLPHDKPKAGKNQI